MEIIAPGDAVGAGERGQWGDRGGGAGVEGREFAMDGAGDGPRDCNSGGATVVEETRGRRSRLIRVQHAPAPSFLNELVGQFSEAAHKSPHLWILVLRVGRRSAVDGAFVEG